MHDAGAGAAGGLGFALKLLAGKIVSGAEYVLDACDFEQVIKTMDWVVTGEGKSDAQTLHGKLPVIVADQARHYGVSSVLISGVVEQAEVMERVFDSVHGACPDGVAVHQAMLNAGPLLQQSASLWARSLHDKW